MLRLLFSLLGKDLSLLLYKIIADIYYEKVLTSKNKCCIVKHFLLLLRCVTGKFRTGVVVWVDIRVG